MSTYQNLNNDPKLKKVKTEDDEIKDLKYKNEKHDHQKSLRALKFDNDFYKKDKSLNKRKVLLIVTEVLIGPASTINSSTLGKLTPRSGFIIASSTALLTSIAILITN